MNAKKFIDLRSLHYWSSSSVWRPVWLGARRRPISRLCKTSRKSWRKTAETIKHYSAAQRDEALSKAKAVMDDLDAKIDKLEIFDT